MVSTSLENLGNGCFLEEVSENLEKIWNFLKYLKSQGKELKEFF